MGAGLGAAGHVMEFCQTETDPTLKLKHCCTQAVALIYDSTA